ncbi:hypothetical protein GIB67_030265 [Kingdonia uniflora]|uniref:Pseudouridine synthase RsuA/RluA-like domain-containing protein n=1 Tax=Kingdonia uniflora TaxID=39325 RepID=A0A7J7M6R6_9MAGN|nr:hypothetical protein GIB67_030265 [Kingdonia uniflora]
MLNSREKTARNFDTFGTPWPDLNDGLTYTDTIKPNITGSSLIDFYSSKHSSSAPLQGWLFRIQNKQITIDGGIVTDPETILRAGSELVYHRLSWKEPDAPYLLEVLYEDDDLVILNKPSGLQVLPGGLFQQRTVLTQLQWRSWKRSSSSSGFSVRVGTQEPHPVPVHRLGRGTSGILLCAKTKIAKVRLAAYFAEGTSVVGDKGNSNLELGTARKISKVYRALAKGILDKDEVVIKQPIGMIRYPGVAKGLYVASPSGKPALSKVNVCEKDMQNNSTIVEVEIQSGRPHQIRIHLSSIGHPLVGTAQIYEFQWDPLYVAGGHPNCSDSESRDDCYEGDGGYQRPTKPVPGDCGYYLHAHQLVVYHPTMNEVINVIAPLPFILQTEEEKSVKQNIDLQKVSGITDCLWCWSKKKLS